MNTKKMFCFCIVFSVMTSILTLQAAAQNQPPSVGNVTVSADTLAHIVTIRYKLSDPESDPLRMTLGISNDSGRTFLVPDDSLQGDRGFPVSGGQQKEIRWYYVPATRSADRISVS